MDTRHPLEGLDPLAMASAEGIDIGSIIESSQKRDVLNILRSYTGIFDAFSEASQNAIDAVEQRSRTSNIGYTPYICITIDQKNNMLRFVDNRIGLADDELKHFLRPSVSFKASQGLRGHKGVGATFLAYGYSSFAVHTKTAAHKTAAVLSGGRQWAESTTNNTPRPKFVGINFDVPELLEEASGTCVEISIGPHRDERPNLGWLNINKADVWLKILRLRTPLGGVYLGTGGIKPRYHLTVVDAQGNFDEVVASFTDAEYLYPHGFSVCARQKDIDDIAKVASEKNISRKDLASKMPAEYRNLDCIWNIWSRPSVIDDAGPFKDDFDDEQKNLVIRHDLHVYACFVRSRTVWDAFQSTELGVRPQVRVIQGGLQLASDFMIQGELTTVPLTTAAGYQANAFIIVHFTNGNPDMGRKVFQPELKEIADIISRRVVAELRKYQSLLKPDTGAGFANSAKELDEWKDDQKQWLRSNTLRLEIDGTRLRIASKPREEQDVIALFHQLVGMRVIRGLTFYSTGYNTRYDGLFSYHYTSDHYFNSINNPFGIDPNVGQEESGLLVLEYKFDLDSLINDFEKNEKAPKEIDLVICWNIGNAYKRHFEIVSLLVDQEGGTREYFAATHAVYLGTGRSSKQFEVICLSDLIEHMTTPDDVVARHKVRFSS